MSVTSEVTAPTLFDYGLLPNAAVSELQKIANKIGNLKRRMTSDAIEIGSELAKAKGKIAHGQFEIWCERECSFSLRAAEAYMSLARSQHKAKLQELPLSIASLLAAASTPPAVVDQVLAESAEGRRPKVAEVKSRIRAARGGTRPATGSGARRQHNYDTDALAAMLVEALDNDQLQRLLDMLAASDAVRKLRLALEIRMAEASKKGEPVAANA